MGRALAVVVLSLFVVGCGVFVAPSPTAGEMADLVSGLVRRGVTITDQISGDPGCSDPTLVGNAIRYDVRMSNETTSAPLYVLRWKSQQTFDASKASFQACVAGFQGAHPGQGLLTYEDSPWRVYGPGFSFALATAVVQAVVAVAGASPPEEIQ